MIQSIFMLLNFSKIMTCLFLRIKVNFGMRQSAPAGVVLEVLGQAVHGANLENRNRLVSVFL